MTSHRDQESPSPAEIGLADRLHSAAIHLLRRLRVEDSAAGLSAPRLSALSVIVFGGPIAMNELARAEQVSPPTISRLADGLQTDGLIERIADPGDRRVQLLRATRKGRRLLEEGRLRRVRTLARALEPLSAADRRLLERAARVLQRISLPDRHPRQGS